MISFVKNVKLVFGSGTYELLESHLNSYCCLETLDMVRKWSGHGQDMVRNFLELPEISRKQLRIITVILHKDGYLKMSTIMILFTNDDFVVIDDYFLDEQNIKTENFDKLL